MDKPGTELANFQVWFIFVTDFGIKQLSCNPDQ